TDRGELELADARRIDDPPAAGHVEADQLGRDGGVRSLLGDVGDVADAAVEPGLDRIQERRLADARLAGEDAPSPGEALAQELDPLPGRGTRQDRRHAHLGERPDERYELDRVYEVGLVEADNGVKLALVRRGDVAV